jgi:hypothetical protein
MLLALIAGLVIAGAGTAAAIEGGSGGDDPSGTWISLIPATSSALAPSEGEAQTPSSVWISLIPATVTSSEAPRQDAGTHPVADSLPGSSGEQSVVAAAGSSSAAATSVTAAAGADPARQGPHAGSLGPAAASVTPWVVLAVVLVLLLGGGALVLSRVRRLRHH